jgi:hypothetical protein
MANLSFTYDELFAALQAWPTDDNDAYVESLPTIIGLGELRLVRDLNLEQFDIFDESEVATIGSRLVDKPNASIIVRDVGIVIASSITFLEKRSMGYCQMFAPSPALTGVPLFWCEYSPTQIMIVPTPAAAYPVHQYVDARPQDSLSLAEQGPSWLSRCVPDALFAACLMESEHFLKADDRYADYKTKYYQELLPIARLELRSGIRNGDYSPLKATAVTA